MVGWIELNWMVEPGYLGVLFWHSCRCCGCFWSWYCCWHCRKQNIKRFYGHWYISVYQLISITKCLCHDNRFGFYSSASFFFYFRCFAMCILWGALCQNRLNTQKLNKRSSTNLLRKQKPHVEVKTLEPSELRPRIRNIVFLFLLFFELIC